MRVTRSFDCFRIHRAKAVGTTSSEGFLNSCLIDYTQQLLPGSTRVVPTHHLRTSKRTAFFVTPSDAITNLDDFVLS